jgi:hypothetical protein
MLYIAPAAGTTCRLVAQLALAVCGTDFCCPGCCQLMQELPVGWWQLTLAVCGTDVPWLLPTAAETACWLVVHLTLAVCGTDLCCPGCCQQLQELPVGWWRNWHWLFVAQTFAALAVANCCRNCLSAGGN